MQIITRPQTTGKTPLLDQQRLECAVAIVRKIERPLSDDLIVIDDQYVSSLDALLLMAVNMRLAAEASAGPVLSDQTRARLIAIKAEMERGGVK